jgi:myo-inositol-1(or 4)-monophosphatase
MSFSDQDIKAYTAFAEGLADAARAQTLPRFRDGIEVANKAGSSFDPVTEADRESERVQRELIAKTYPEHGIIGEEFGASGADRPWRWVLDPIDGTRAFVCGITTWTTLIALEFEQRPVLSVIDQPFTDERWIASSGATVFRRGAESTVCKTSGVTDLNKARISTTDPRPTAYFTEHEAAAYARIAELSRIERFSLDAYGYGHIALGELDLIIESGLQHYDYAALVPAIEGAGGVITNWRGEPVGSDDRNEVLAAATPDLHAAAMKILRE